MASVYVWVLSVNPFVLFACDVCPVVEENNNKSLRRRTAFNLFDALITKYVLVLVFVQACSFNSPKLQSQTSTFEKCYYEAVLNVCIQQLCRTTVLSKQRYMSFVNSHHLANKQSVTQGTRGIIFLHGLQHTNYLDYRAAWVYMSAGECECLCLSPTCASTAWKKKIVFFVLWFFRCSLMNLCCRFVSKYA